MRNKTQRSREVLRQRVLDLGYHDSDAMLIKAQLVAKISEIIRTRNLTQSEAASKLGLTQPKISALLKGNFRGFSEHRLLDCLTRLGRDVQIVIRPIPKSRRNGKLSVLFTHRTGTATPGAKQRLLRRIRNAPDRGTPGKISWTRDELHER
jgi:predicted XRE-type DNA-binding protein